MVRSKVEQKEPFAAEAATMEVVSNLCGSSVCGQICVGVQLVVMKFVVIMGMG